MGLSSHWVSNGCLLRRGHLATWLHLHPPYTRSDTVLKPLSIPFRLWSSLPPGKQGQGCCQGNPGPPRAQGPPPGPIQSQSQHVVTGLLPPRALLSSKCRIATWTGEAEAVAHAPAGTVKAPLRGTQPLAIKRKDWNPLVSPRDKFPGKQKSQ